MTNAFGYVGTAITALLAFDASFETFRAGSDEWVWVAGLTVIVLAWQAWLLVARKPLFAAWSGAVGLLLYPLLGLWFPRAADAGVVMLGLGTRELSIVGVAFGVAGAAAAIATVPRLPAALRVAVALLALYALAAFGLGLRQHADLVDLVSGASLWTRLPVWLQGAFIGSAVLLPVALLVVLGRGVMALRYRQSQHWSLQAVAIVLCLLMVGPAFGVGSREAHPAVAPIASTQAAARNSALPLPDPSPSATPPQDIAPLPNAELIPVGDPQQRLSDAHGRLTPLRYSRSARAATFAAGYEDPFRFVRDHVGFDAYQGVLRGGIGTYLQRSGNAWDRALLLADFIEERGLKRRFARGTLDGLTVERLYARIFVSPQPAEGDRAANAPAAGQNITLQRLRTRAERDYRAVITAVGSTLSVIGARTAREQALTELRDHVWVQVEVDGTWLDLDPSFPDATPGQTLTTATAIFDAPPASMHQRVTVRVTTDTIEGTTPRETEVLTTSMNTIDIVGRPIILAHAQGRGQGGGFGGMFNAVSGEMWTPLLWIDGETRTGRPIRFGSGGDAADFFGGSGPQLVAEWLEVITQRPDGTRDVSRRLLGSKATIAPRNDNGSLAPQTVHAIWFTAGAHHLLDYTEAVQALARLSADSRAQPENDQLLWAVGIRTFPIVAWSEHVVMPAADADPGVRVYNDSPRAIVVSLGWHPQQPDRPLVEYDLLRDRVRALPRDDRSERSAVDRRVWFGALEGALEHELAATAVAASGGQPSDLVSTSGLLTSAGITTTHGERGITRVIPASQGAQPRGWWEIETDGTTRAVLENRIGGSSYSPHTGGGPGRWLRPGRGALPGPGSGGGSWIDPRTGRELKRLGWDGRWHTTSRTPPARGATNEYSLLLVVVTVVAIVAWSIVALEIAVLVIHASHAVESLPVESSAG